MKTSIRGIGAVGGFGCGVKKLTAVLSSGKSITQTVALRSDSKTETRVFVADTSELSSYIAPKSLRRINNYSKLALLGASLALEDSSMHDLDRTRMGIIIASGYGAMNTTFSFLDSVMDKGKDEHASPIHFANSVHNSAAAHISILMKIEGPSLTVSQFEMSFPSALFTAHRWLEEKRVDSVLLGGVDEFSNVLGYCGQQFLKKDDDSRISPFEFNKQTAIPGGGTAFFVLTRDTQNDSEYCAIEDVHIGNLQNNTLTIPEDAYLFIGADGNKISGQKYPLVLNKRNNIAAYSPLYGSFPTATALDLAIAGISIKKSCIFASPEYSGCEDARRILKENETNQGKICCLKICDHDEYSLITVNKNKR